ncbi:peptide synthase [Nocardia yunnanensis]|uniref:Peptide synthase n=1 Tax=Nocardia yunnanensis TaxID=2382165 RepID=A0A386Z735_9NOCA|nr:fatty acid CoA ligase family protein [Nocardia yunnanensis]AYF72937.1 peptide synthase [Nocardia yunnanensis]
MSSATYWQAIDRFRAVVAADPDREAVFYPAGKTASGLPDYRHLTYRELDEWSDTIGLHLITAGVGRGTRTIVLVLPSPELYAIMLGLLKIGAVPVVIDPGMGLRKMLNCLRAADAEAFIGIPQAHAARVLFRRYFRSVRVTLTVGPRWFWGGPTLRDWDAPVTTGRLGDRLRSELATTGPRGAKAAARLEELLAALESRRAARASEHRAPFDAFTLRDRVPAPGDELLLIAYTTGSTGPAKAVEMTHGNLSAMLEQVHAARGRVDPGTSLITLPLVGILDMLLGSRCVLPPLVPSKVGSTDPAHVVDALNRFGVRTMFASPAVLIPLLRHLEQHRTPVPTLHSIFSGGAPVPDWCIAGLRRVLAADAEVYAGYGSTEALPMSTIESRELLDGLAERAQLGDGTCVGRPAEGVRARLVAITDDPLPTWAQAEARESELVGTRGIGELVVSGPNVSTRYYWPESANAAGKIHDGDVIWHRTGDLAWIDGEERIWFCGRKSQRLQTVDGPMFSVQVEQVFNALPGVARTALVGVGSRGTQLPVLCVEAEPGADTTVLIAELRKRAAEFEVTAPVSTFLFHPEFPVDIRHNAKIGREQLAVWAAERLGKDNGR